MPVLIPKSILVKAAIKLMHLTGNFLNKLTIRALSGMI